MLEELIPIAFLTEIGIIFWFKNAKRVLEIPIPEINIVQIEINDKNCEKLSIKFLMPIAEFPGKRILKFFNHTFYKQLSSR